MGIPEHEMYRVRTQKEIRAKPNNKPGNNLAWGGKSDGGIRVDASEEFEEEMSNFSRKKELL